MLKAIAATYVCLVTRHGCVHTSPWTGILRSPWRSHPYQVFNWKRHIKVPQSWCCGVWVADRHKFWGLIGLHNLTNVDWARKFVEITKTTWVGAFYDYDSAMHQLQHALCRYCTNMHQLFQISWWQYIPIKLVNGNCHSRSRVQSSLSATQQVPQTLTVTGSQ